MEITANDTENAEEPRMEETSTRLWALLAALVEAARFLSSAFLRVLRGNSRQCSVFPLHLLRLPHRRPIVV